MPIRIGLQHIDRWNESLEKQVVAYEQENAPLGQIVFYGPSNFTRWSRKWEHTPLREAIVGASGAACCINRGFGSTCPEHQLYYYPRMVKALQPKVLVYTPLPGNGTLFGYSRQENFELAQRVVAYALADFPDIKIYLSGSSPTRDITPEKMAEREAYSALIKEFVKSTPRCTYVDILNHKPLWEKDLYVADGVHYNQKGYDVYADFFREVLKDELAEF